MYVCACVYACMCVCLHSLCVWLVSDSPACWCQIGECFPQWACLNNRKQANLSVKRLGLGSGIVSVFVFPWEIHSQDNLTCEERKILGSRGGHFSLFFLFVRCLWKRQIAEWTATRASFSSWYRTWRERTDISVFQRVQDALRQWRLKRDIAGWIAAYINLCCVPDRAWSKKRPRKDVKKTFT